MAENCSYRVNGKTYFGTTPKYVLEIDSGVPMADIDFEVRLVCGDNSLTVRKSEMPVDRDGKFYLCFDTRRLGVGWVKAIVTATIPDSDFSDGRRREVYVVNNLLDIKEV